MRSTVPCAVLGRIPNLWDLQHIVAAVWGLCCGKKTNVRLLVLLPPRPRPLLLLLKLLPLLALPQQAVLTQHSRCCLQAVKQLLLVEERRKGGAYAQDTMCVGISRLGAEDQQVPMHSTCGL